MPKNPDAPFYRELRDAEREILERYVHAAGSVTKAAELAGIDRKSFHDRARVCGADLNAAKVAGKAAARRVAAGVGETSG